ncbi:GTP cyclohydrolase I FolE2 [Candidatus Methylacidiphilum infernorum]|uniref:GTP cyclohydrolase FolE2 n=1 Tax=Candidatus Methylacidiphilum infernorum TaxID=511746 RepID=A0ABX7PTC8_9BACT|nr:GTP cyclohydrolase FolE2 [Candidatus Methylacidiphilum infernorum]QSR86024.1 GTP cyclohydrolase I FolE2 [Candidatus Methylacidiphilum infernorum]
MKNISVTALADCQSQKDHRKIKINRVGVKGLKYPIEVRDKNFESQHTVATVSLLVDLPHHFKGTHMSRFVEVLNSHGRMVHVSNVFAIVRELQRKLHAETAHVILEFPYFIEKKAPVTESKGLVDYLVRFEAAAYLDETDFVMWVTVPVTTLCPCSKAISDRGAHNQRGYVSVALRFIHTIWIEDVIEIVESSASSPIYSLLKRPDEKYVTEQAFDNPVFVEDLVRNVALRLNANPDIFWYRVEAENMESIHNHAAYACVEKGAES